ncbi:MAG: hypothetical protein AAGA75_10935 [Cyanobacteria bacterium P01_E01_bin.6]
MIATQQLEGGLGCSVVAMVKAIATTEAQQVNGDILSQAVHPLLITIHIIQIDNAESELIDSIPSKYCVARSAGGAVFGVLV